jgi:hypothetical protein
MNFKSQMFKTLAHWSLRATKGSVAISFFSKHFEIASVALLPRKDSNREGNLFLTAKTQRETSKQRIQKTGVRI